jgi:hypothetical protein
MCHSNFELVVLIFLFIQCIIEAVICCSVHLSITDDLVLNMKFIFLTCRVDYCFHCYTFIEFSRMLPMNYFSILTCPDDSFFFL